MYRVDLMRTSYGQYLRLLTFTKNYNYGDGSDITVNLNDIDTNKSKVVNGDELYNLIGAGEVVFGVVDSQYGLRVCTLCSEKASHLYRGFECLGQFTDSEFLDSVKFNDRKKAGIWLLSGKAFARSCQRGLEYGILGLDDIMISDDESISWYDAFFKTPDSASNSMTNILDYFISNKDNIGYYLNSLVFFVKMKSNITYSAFGYKLPNKYLLEIM